MPEIMLIAIFLCSACIGFFIKRRTKERARIEGEICGSLDDRIREYKAPMDLHEMSAFNQLIHTIRQQASGLSHCTIFRDESKKLWRISEEGDKPLLVLVMGEFSTGKSTFINTLLGAEVLTTAQIPTTAVVSLLSYGEKTAVKLHHQDGRVTEYDFAKLDEITAEGDDSKQVLRDNLEYVEIQYPNKMLKKINIVDTPGLNAHREKHTANTINFQEKADVVLWMFKADAGGRSTELSAIKKLGKRLKPIAVVNCIDNVLESDDYEEDEDPVEETLKRFRRRVGDSVEEVIGISALLAKQALVTGDQAALKACGWTKFKSKLNETLVNRSAELKKLSMKEKLTDFIRQISQVFEQYDKKHRNDEKIFKNQKSAEREINAEIKNLEKIQKHLRNGIEQAEAFKDEYQTTYGTRDVGAIDDTDQLLEIAFKLGKQVDWVVPLLEILPSDDRWNPAIHDIQLMQETREKIIHSYEKWFTCYGSFARRLQDLEQEAARVAELRNEYENSGFFGGTPIFDFSGRRERLNTAVDSYKSNVEGLQNDLISHWKKYQDICKSAISVNSDVVALEKKLCKLMDVEVAYENARLTRMKEDFQLEKQRHANEKAELKYAKQTIKVLESALVSLI